MKDDFKVAGDHNDIKTVQDKQYALIHIENRIKQTGDHLINIKETASNTRLLTWGTMGAVIIILVGLLAHYRCVQLPKRSVQLEMTDRQSDQIETIQDALVAHGYLPTPKKKNRRKGGKAKKAGGRRSRIRWTAPAARSNNCCSQLFVNATIFFLFIFLAMVKTIVLNI